MNKIQELMQNLEASKDFEDLFSMMMLNGKGKHIFEYYDGELLVQVSYEEFIRKVWGSAKRLRDLVNPEEEFVGLRLPNGPEFCILYWAILAAGHSVLLLNYHQGVDAAIDLMAQAGTETLITDKSSEEIAYLPASSLITEQEEAPENKWGDRIALCTSGTTGDARIYVHNSFSIINLAKCLIKLSEDTDRWYRPEVNEKCLAFLPFHHVFGLMAVFMLTFLGGNTFVFIPSLAPDVVLDSCKKHKITQLISIPLFWNALVKGLYRRIRMTEGEGKIKSFERLIEANLKAQAAGKKLPFFLANKLKAIRNQLLGDDIYLCASGGGYIPHKTMRIINGLGYYLVNGYGMTEAGIISVCNDENVKVRLNGNVGEPFEPNSTMLSPAGEIMLRGGCLHTGILKAGKFQPVDYSGDNWFATGDIGRIENGLIYIDGRLKEVIIGPSGENIYPDTVEAEFQDLPGVAQLNVVGIKEDEYEYATLVLELAPDVDLEELDKAIKVKMIKLPPSSTIANVLVSLKPLPLSTTRKVKRQLLAAEIKEGRWPSQTLSRYMEGENGDAGLKADDNTRAKGSKKKSEAKEDKQKDNQREKIRETVRGFFAEALDIDPGEVTDGGHFVLDLGGDSLASLTLLNLLENEYSIDIVDDEYYNCMNLNDITSLIYEHITGNVDQASRKPAVERIRPPVERVDSIEKIKEIQQFVKRSEALLASSNMHNPYFISQESPLTDVSCMDGRQMLNFGSYNYLAMSGDPEVNAAAIAAVEKYGTSASGSRLLAGEKDIHKKLEAAIARWKNTEDSLVLVSGHATNVTFIGNFCTVNDLIIYDRLSHNSVIQGVSLSRAQSKYFPHNDYEALDDFLTRNRDKYAKVLIIIEGAYSMDGDVAPVPEFVRIKKKHGCFLLVDEAHSACVLGENGSGVDEHFQLAPDDVDIKMGTLSKGLGTCGGYLAGSKLLIEYLRYNLPGFTFSVGLSPALAGAALKVLEIMQRDNSRVKSLQRNIAYFLEQAKARGLDTCLAQDTAIVPILVGPEGLAFKLSIDMQADGIIVPPAIFPAVPRGQARLRYCLTSAHKPQQIDKALDVLQEHLARAKEQLG